MSRPGEAAHGHGAAAGAVVGEGGRVDHVDPAQEVGESYSRVSVDHFYLINIVLDNCCDMSSIVDLRLSFVRLSVRLSFDYSKRQILRKIKK